MSSLHDPHRAPRPLPASPLGLRARQVPLRSRSDGLRAPLGPLRSRSAGLVSTGDGPWAETPACRPGPARESLSPEGPREDPGRDLSPSAICRSMSSPPGRAGVSRGAVRRGTPFDTPCGVYPEPVEGRATQGERTADFDQGRVWDAAQLLRDHRRHVVPALFEDVDAAPSEILIELELHPRPERCARASSRRRTQGTRERRRG